MKTRTQTLRINTILILCASLSHGASEVSFEPIETYTPQEQHRPQIQSFDELFIYANKFFAQNNFDEAVSYYKQALAIRPTCPQVFFNMGLALNKQKKHTAAIHAFKQAILHKIDYPKAHVQLGKTLHTLKQTKEAIEHYRLALLYDPKLTTVRLLLARLYNEQHMFTQSIELLKKSLNIEPENIHLLFELANTYNTINQIQDALAIYKKLLAKQPNNVAFLYNTAYTLKKMGKIEEALPYYNKTLELKPDHSEAHFSRGLAYLTYGDFLRGWAEYEWRWQRPKHGSKRNYTQPRWDGSPLNGKTILLHAEQGLGDTFQFIRFAQIAKNRGGCVIAAVQSPLVDILSLCPYLDHVISTKDTPPPFDVHAPIMSLPFILKTTIDTVPCDTPYLYADQKLVEYWQEQLAYDNNFKVGICWQGNCNYSTPFLRAVVAQKSIKLNQLTPISTIPGISIYNLQKKTGEEQLPSAHFKLHTFDSDFDESHGRFMDTAAVMKNLDLVITVDTSICHLAAGLGVPTWNILPNPADWRWMLNRTDTPWYPTMRLFKQPKSGDWNSVIHTIAQELMQLAHGKDTQLPRPINQSSSSLIQLHEELETLLQKMQTLWKYIKNSNTLHDVSINKVRQFYLLSQMHKMIEEKIKIVQ